MTIEQYAERHAIPGQRRGVYAELRSRARQLAKRLGAPTPEWALPRAREGKPVAWSGRTERSPRVPSVGAGAAVSTEMPEPLRDWHRRTPGGVVQISRRGVVLHTLDGSREFPDVATAIVAIDGQATTANQGAE